MNSACLKTLNPLCACGLEVLHVHLLSTGRSAFIGVGFGDRGDAFDFNVALQDHFK